MLNLANPPQYDAEIYARIPLIDLVVYSMHFLHTQGVEITSEDIVSACFTLFPKRFSLLRYPYWPDSAVVHRRWSDCKRKGYIVGSVANGFKLTPRGFKFAQKVEKMLGGVNSVSGHALPAEVRTRAGRFVRAMEGSEAFKEFRKHGRNSRLNEYDFRSMLLCTLESTHETLRRNLDQFRQYAQVSERRDLLVFLDYSENKFSHLLLPPKKPSVKKARKAKGRK